MTRLLLVRHCVSSSDFSDSPLTDTGFRQAESLVSFLTRFDIDFIVSSPYLRALQTIAPFARHQALKVHEDARLQERELSTGPLPDWLDHLELSFGDLDYRLPTGESSREAQQRAWQAIDEIVEADHRCPALVAHGNLISLILHRIDPSIDFEFWRGLSNPDVYVLERDRDAAWTSKRVWKPGGWESAL